MSQSTQSELIPVTLLTGFLGSGKTTLLNHLVRQPEMADALVIINEFGEMPLDHALVAHSTENVVMEMSSGCLCCTIRGDLTKTLQDIAWRFARNGQRQFRRVMIETTGLADPAPMLHTLMTHSRIASRYRLDGVVTVLDMATGEHTLDHHFEAVKQAAVADCLLLTKADLATDEQRVAITKRLTDINPAAPRKEISNGAVPAKMVLDLGLFSTTGKGPDVERWLREEAYAGQEPHSHHGHHHSQEPHNHDDLNRHDDHIRAFCFVIDEPIPQALLDEWLEVLMSFVGRDVLRVKGLLNVEGRDRPFVIHGVQHVFHPPISLPAWPSEDRRSRLVFITRDVGRKTIEETFYAFRDILPRTQSPGESEGTISGSA